MPDTCLALEKNGARVDYQSCSTHTTVPSLTIRNTHYSVVPRFDFKSWSTHRHTHKSKVYPAGVSTPHVLIVNSLIKWVLEIDDVYELLNASISVAMAGMTDFVF